MSSDFQSDAQNFPIVHCSQTQCTSQVRQSWKHFCITHLHSCEGKKAKSKWYPASSIPGRFRENQLHSKGWEIKKRELLLCWKSMQHLPSATFGVSGDELRACSPCKVPNSATEPLTSSSEGDFPARPEQLEWPNLIPVHQWQHKGRGSQQSFALKLCYFRHFLTTFPPNSFWFTLPALSMTCVLPCKLSCSEIILWNRNDAFQAQQQCLALQQSEMCSGQHQSEPSQTIPFKGALMTSSWTNQEKWGKET